MWLCNIFVPGTQQWLRHQIGIIVVYYSVSMTTITGFGNFLNDKDGIFLIMVENWLRGRFVFRPVLLHPAFFYTNPSFFLIAVLAISIQHMTSPSVINKGLEKTPICVQHLGRFVIQLVLLHHVFFYIDPFFFSYRRAIPIQHMTSASVTNEGLKSPILVEHCGRLSFILCSLILILPFFLLPCLLFICNTWPLYLWQMKD